MTDITIFEILICALCSSLGLLVQHYGFAYLLKKELPRLAAYIMGVSVMLLPVSVMFYLHGLVVEVVALWSIVFSSGLSVMGAWTLDCWVQTSRNKK